MTRSPAGARSVLVSHSSSTILYDDIRFYMKFYTVLYQGFLKIQIILIYMILSFVHLPLSTKLLPLLLLLLLPLLLLPPPPLPLPLPLLLLPFLYKAVPPYSSERITIHYTHYTLFILYTLYTLYTLFILYTLYHYTTLYHTIHTITVLDFATTVYHRYGRCDR